MEPPPAKTGLFVGLNKGHVVTKRELPPRPSAHKGVSINASMIVQSFRSFCSDGCFVSRVTVVKLCAVLCDGFVPPFAPLSLLVGWN